jgi:hypothetical protein
MDIPRELTVARLVDLPFRLLRPHLLQFLLPLSAAFVVLAAPFQIASAQGLFTVDPANPKLGSLAVFVGMAPLALLGYSMVSITTNILVIDTFEGRAVDLASALRRAVTGQKVLVSIFLNLGLILGSACCVVPGIAFTAYLSLAIPVVILEGRPAGASLQRGLDLVRGGRNGPWWGPVIARSVAAVLVMVTLQYALGTLVALPTLPYIFKAAFESAASGYTANVAGAVPWWIQAISSLGQGAVYALVCLYDAAAMWLIYRYARERLEGTDLQAAIPTAEKT